MSAEIIQLNRHFEEDECPCPACQRDRVEVLYRFHSKYKLSLVRYNEDGTVRLTNE